MNKPMKFTNNPVEWINNNNDKQWVNSPCFSLSEMCNEKKWSSLEPEIKGYYSWFDEHGEMMYVCDLCKNWRGFKCGTEKEIILHMLLNHLFELSFQ